MQGIAEMFAELNGYEEYQQDLFCWLLRQQSQKDSTGRRESNRGLFRAHWRKSSAVYRERKKALGISPEVTEKRRAYKRAWIANKRAEARAA